MSGPSARIVRAAGRGAASSSSSPPRHAAAPAPEGYSALTFDDVEAIAEGSAEAVQTYVRETIADVGNAATQFGPEPAAGWGAATGRAIVVAIKGYFARETEPLRSRLATLEAQIAVLQAERSRYRGVFSRLETYSPRDFCTHAGSLWSCVKPTSGGMPPPQDAWLLMSKSPHAETISALERRISMLENPAGKIAEIRRARP